MENSQKGTSSVNAKVKDSFLDEDIGKDFLSSWKSMAVTEDDAMDFNFNTISSGKNTAFNFEKLDMDFGLDGDFDKLSSFKVDMSDFDLSAPSKKVAKPKDISADESSTGKPPGKKRQFNFSFDFNELDNFNFESSLVNEEKVSSQNNDDKLEIVSHGTEQRSSKLQLSEDTSASDDAIATELPASKGVATSNFETLLSDPGHRNAILQDCAKHVCSGAPNLSRSSRSSTEEGITISTKAKDQQNHLSEKAISMDTHSQQTTFDFPGQSLVGVDSNKDSLSYGQTKISHRGTGVNTTPSRKDDKSDKITGVPSYHETLPLKNSSPMSITASSSNTDKTNKSDTDISKEMDDNESAVRDLELAEDSTSSVCRKALHDIKENEGNQILATELPPDLLSGPVADIVTIRNEKEAGGLHLKFSKRDGSALETKSISLGSERTGPTHKSPATEKEMGSKSNDAQPGFNSVGNPVPVARELRNGEDIAKNANHLNNIGKGFTSDGLPNGCKLVGKSRLHGEEVKKGKPDMSTSEKNAKHQNATRFQASPLSLLENQGNSNIKICLNPQLLVSSLESVRNSKIKSVEGNKLCLVRSPKKIRGVPIMKISKTKGDEKVSDSTPQKDINSLQSPNQDMEVQDNAASETAYPPSSTEKKIPSCLSLKRKAFELSNSDLVCLTPLKRLSSPSENRDFKEPPQQVVEGKLSRVEKSLKPLNDLSRALGGRDVKEPLKTDDVKEYLRRIEGEKVCGHENQEESTTERILYCVPISKTESPQEVNVMDLQISSIMENDGNVEQAKAYAKELEDICNMLRKKHEEAKEILVRALVSNNNLLMLNHPICEEKICKVQKFAAELMSKELKM